MGMWLQATTVSWMGHWKETVQSTDTVHGTCTAQWQNVERDTETRFCLQTRSEYFNSKYNGKIPKYISLGSI